MEIITDNDKFDVEIIKLNITEDTLLIVKTSNTLNGELANVLISKLQEAISMVIPEGVTCSFLIMPDKFNVETMSINLLKEMIKKAESDE